MDEEQNKPNSYEANKAITGNAVLPTRIESGADGSEQVLVSGLATSCSRDGNNIHLTAVNPIVATLGMVNMDINLTAEQASGLLSQLRVARQRLPVVTGRVAHEVKMGEHDTTTSQFAADVGRATHNAQGIETHRTHETAMYARTADWSTYQLAYDFTDASGQIRRATDTGSDLNLHEPIGGAGITCTVQEAQDLKETPRGPYITLQIHDRAEVSGMKRHVDGSIELDSEAQEELMLLLHEISQVDGPKSS